jgi:hypothetical protein
VIINENRTLAESNLDMEPKLIEIRSRINDLTQTGKELSQSVQAKLQEISESSKCVKHDEKYKFEIFFRVKILKHESGEYAGYFESIGS